MAKSLPKTLFVKIDGNPGGEFFSADDAAESLVEMGQKVKIGTYQLVEVVYAEGIASFAKSLPPKRRR